jgi:UDP-N-acetylmuramate dehydrogenase
VVSLEDLQKVFRGEIRISEPLSQHTWLKIGGPADYFLKPSDREDIVHVVGFFRDREFPYMIIGRGSNLLVHDEGFRGAMINLEDVLSGIRPEDGDVSVDAGVWISTFVDFCIKNGFAGTEMLAGIPGTIGGAIRMNAGAYGGEISDYLLEVEAIRDSKVVRIKKEDAGFSYRKSGFTEDIVLSARFRFPKKDKEDLIRIRRELLIKRNAAQPVNFPNTGSIFKNPEGSFAAKLIDNCGLKGKRIGGAMISDLHANFIVNVENASSRDVFDLMVLMRNEVFKRFGIVLDHEVLLVGFSKEEMSFLQNAPTEITG